MEKIIEIGGKEVKLSNNVSWTMEYRDQFQKDIIPSIMPLVASLSEAIASVVAEGEVTVESIAEAIQGRALDVLLPLWQAEFVDLFVDVTWAMAKAADETINPPKQWAKQFESFELDIVCPALLELVLKGFVSSKNVKRLKGLKATLQPLRSTISSSPQPSEG